MNSIAPVSNSLIRAQEIESNIESAIPIELLLYIFERIGDDRSNAFSVSRRWSSLRDNLQWKPLTIPASLKTMTFFDIAQGLIVAANDREFKVINRQTNELCDGNPSQAGNVIYKGFHLQGNKLHMGILQSDSSGIRSDTYDPDDNVSITQIHHQLSLFGVKTPCSNLATFNRNTNTLRSFDHSGCLVWEKDIALHPEEIIHLFSCDDHYYVLIVKHPRCIRLEFGHKEEEKTTSPKDRELPDLFQHQASSLLFGFHGAQEKLMLGHFAHPMKDPLTFLTLSFRQDKWSHATLWKEYLITVTQRNQVHALNVRYSKSLELVRPIIPLSGPVLYLTFCDDLTAIVHTNVPNEILVIHLFTGTLLKTIKHTENLNSLFFLNRSNHYYLAGNTEAGNLTIWKASVKDVQAQYTTPPSDG